MRPFEASLTGGDESGIREIAPEVRGFRRSGAGHISSHGGNNNEGSPDMVVLGLILLIIGLVASIPVLTTIGAILLIVGLVLNLVPMGGSTRRVW
jgi:hypothetical protein